MAKKKPKKSKPARQAVASQKHSPAPGRLAESGVELRARADGQGVEFNLRPAEFALPARQVAVSKAFAFRDNGELRFVFVQEHAATGAPTYSLCVNLDAGQSVQLTNDAGRIKSDLEALNPKRTDVEWRTYKDTLADLPHRRSTLIRATFATLAFTGGTAVVSFFLLHPGVFHAYGMGIFDEDLISPLVSVVMSTPELYGLVLQIERSAEPEQGA